MSDPIEAEPQRPSRNHWFWWGAVLLLFLITRVVAFQQMGSSIFGDRLLKDANSYHVLAQFMAADVWQQDMAYFFSPGYPILLGSWYWLTEAETASGRLLNVLLSFLTLHLIAHCGRMLSGPRAAIAAGFGWIICENTIFFEQLILTEIASSAALMGLATLGVWLLKDADTSQTRKVLLGSLGMGILLGISALFRTNFVVVGLVFVLLAARACWANGHRSRIVPAALLFLLGAAIPITPCAVHNWRAEQVFIPISSNFGLNFYIGNNENAIGVYDAPPSVLDEDRGAPLARAALENPTANSRDIDRFWRREAFTYIRENPAGFARLLLRKILLLLYHYEFPQIYDADSMRDDIGILALPWPTYGAYFPLGIGGIFVLSRRRDPHWRFILWSMLAVMLSLLPFFITGRYRFACLPLMLLPAAVGIDSLALAIRERDRPRVRNYLFGVAVGCFLCWVPWVELDPRFRGLRAAADERFFELKAALHMEVEDWEGAEAILATIPEESLGSVGLFQLAHLREMQLHFCEAARLLRRATDQQPSEAIMWFNRAHAEMRCGLREDARDSYLRAFSIDPFLPVEGMVDLAELSMEEKDWNSAAAASNFALERDPNNRRAALIFERAYEKLQQEGAVPAGS